MLEKWSIMLLSVTPENIAFCQKLCSKVLTVPSRIILIAPQSPPVPTTSSWKECARSNSLSIMLEIKEQVWEDSSQATEFLSCSTATSRKFTRSLIMPGLFSMIWLQQYAQNYTGIIFLFLLKNLIFQWLFFYQNEVFLFITKRNSICLIAFQWFPSGSGTQDKINVC